MRPPLVTFRKKTINLLREVIYYMGTEASVLVRCRGRYKIKKTEAGGGE